MASEPKQASGKKQRTDERTARQRIYDWFFGFSYTTRVTVTFFARCHHDRRGAMGVLSYVWEEHFQAYTRENVQQLADTTAANIANRYERSNSATLDAIGEGNKMSYPSLSINDVEPAESVHMLQPGMGIQVISSSTETVVYDSSRPNGSSYSSSNSIDETGSFAPSDGKMASAAITLGDGQVVGTVQIWVYGSDLLLSKADQEFRMQSYQACALPLCYLSRLRRLSASYSPVAWCALLIASRKRRRKSRKATFRLA